MHADIRPAAILAAWEHITKICDECWLGSCRRDHQAEAAQAVRDAAPIIAAVRDVIAERVASECLQWADYCEHPETSPTTFGGKKGPQRHPRLQAAAAYRHAASFARSVKAEAAP